MLLKAGADVNAIGGPYGTALQAAAWAEDIETVKVLLEAGADVSITEHVVGEYGTALQAASAAGSFEIVEALLEKDAIVNVSPANGKHGCALTAAAAGGYDTIVKLLIDHKADVNAKGGLHGFPILAASQNGDSDSVQLLLENGANASVQGGLLGSAVAAAAYGNNLHIIERLVEHGADVHATGGKYGNALQAAAIKADIEIIDDILNRAIELVNQRSGKYHTALIAASYFNRMEVVSKLLDAGADFRFQGGKYRSAINAAAIRGNKAILDKYLSMGPPDHLLDEALVEACAFRQSSSVEVLLKAGANVTTRHPTLGLPFDALAATEAEDENSDVEDEDEDEEDDEDDEDEDEDEEGEDDEWEGDNVSESGLTEEGSVTDLQLEDEVSEETKIQKLLEEAIARCKRNPTVKRFRTIKHREIPHSLSVGGPPPVPRIPPLPSVPAQPSYQQPYPRQNSLHSQEPWSIPFQSSTSNEFSEVQYGQHYPNPSVTDPSAHPAPLFAKQQMQSPSSTPQRIQSPQQQQSTSPQRRDQRKESPYSTGSTPEPSGPYGPPRQNSSDSGIKRQSKAFARKPLTNPGPAGRYQDRQPSYPNSFDPLKQQVATHDYAAPDQHPPMPPAPQQYSSPPLVHQQPQQFQYGQQGQQTFHQTPPPMQYAPYAPPPGQGSGYPGYNSMPQNPPGPTNMHNRQSVHAPVYGNQPQASWDMPPVNRPGGYNHTQEPDNSQSRRWGNGGYEGEGYG